ncbi:MAG: GTP-binding protein, partial [Enhydrobacter sp.]|nr:GTP-binding protein [Enhydrobacter sp.]
ADLAALSRSLTGPALGILRAKAIVADGDRRRALHIVGARAAIDDAPPSARPGLLVAIGLRGQLDAAAIGQALLSQQPSHPP